MDPHPMTVTSGLTFHTHDAWSETNCEIAGELSDGREVRVATHNSHQVAPRDRIAALRVWLEGGVLSRPGHGAPPVLVVPLDHVSERCLAEAVRRWALRDLAQSA